MKKQQINIEKELERLKNEAVFKVPENYFEDFSGRLRARLAEESKPVQRVSWISIYLRPAFSIAAVLAILFMAVYIPLNRTMRVEKNGLVQNKNILSSDSSQNNDQFASFEALSMLPQSQFLSTLEEVESQPDSIAIDQKALEEYIADNTNFDYEILNQ